MTNWYSVASSANGSNLVAVGYAPLSGGIIKGFGVASTNAGTTWNPINIPSTVSWFSLASSADGSKLVSGAISGTTAVYTSTNFGATWTIALHPQTPVISIACSADGTKLAAATQGPVGYIYRSVDSGATWITNSFPGCSWQSIISSSDGSKLTAVSGGYSNYFSGFNVIFVPTPGPIYSSSDSGITWTSNNAPNLQWYAAAGSADGNKLYAVESTDGQIYTSQTMPSPQLNLTPSPINLMLAWTIPSTNFNLQQSTDLVSWVDMTNLPVLNLTNLQEQAFLPSSSDSGFYRLKSP